MFKIAWIRTGIGSIGAHYALAAVRSVCKPTKVTITDVLIATPGGMLVRRGSAGLTDGHSQKFHHPYLPSSTTVSSTYKVLRTSSRIVVPVGLDCQLLRTIFAQLLLGQRYRGLPRFS